MNSTRKLMALGAAGSLLALSASTGLAQSTTDPTNPNQPNPTYQPGMNEPGGAVQDRTRPDASRPDLDRADPSRNAADNQADDRSWMEQIRDWWNSDQGEVKTVSGTIIDLETYLINGEEAARQQSNSSGSLYDSDPVALLTEGGELYILLDRYEQRMTGASFGYGANPAATSNNANRPGAASSTAADRARANPAVTGTATTPGSQAHAGMSGQAGDFKTHRLSAGHAVSLSGNVYDRGGIKGLLVQGYTVEAMNKAGQPGHSGMDGNRMNRPVPAAGQEVDDRATPRPRDAERENSGASSGNMSGSPSSPAAQPDERTTTPRPSTNSGDAGQ